MGGLATLPQLGMQFRSLTVEVKTALAEQAEKINYLKKQYFYNLLFSAGAVSPSSGKDCTLKTATNAKMKITGNLSIFYDTVRCRLGKRNTKGISSFDEHQKDACFK